MNPNPVTKQEIRAAFRRDSHESMVY